MAKVIVTGATGLIGRELIARLADRGDTVIALSRDAGRARSVLGDAVEAVSWEDPTLAPPPEAALAGGDAVIHLLGEPIAQRWTEAVKETIRDSRILATRQLVAGLRALDDDRRPRVLVSQSATGYYGPCGIERIDESATPGTDFLAQVVVGWEQEAIAAEPLMRVVRARTGVVLTGGGGALALMLPFFKAGIGGPVAGGRQYVPWIHLEDEVGCLLHCLDDETIAGAVNLAAPGAVDNREFSKTLGRALHRPAALPVPGLALKLLYGEMAIIVTTGQHVVPARLQAAGYEFSYPEIGAALAAAVHPAPPPRETR